jgi:hypothetical protein
MRQNEPGWFCFTREGQVGCKVEKTKITKVQETITKKLKNQKTEKQK